MKIPKRVLYSVEKADSFLWLADRRAGSIEAVVTDPPYGVLEYTTEELQKKKNGKGIWRLPQAYDGYARASMPRFTVLKATDHEKIKAFHERLAPLLLRVLVPGAHVIMASHSLLSHLTINAFVNTGFELRGQLARIVKTLRGGDRPKGAHEEYPDVCVTPRSCWEPWLIFRKPCDGLVRDNLEKWGTGALRRPHRNVPFPDVIHSAPVRGSERAVANHPSVKPQAFLRQVVAAALPMKRGVVLDPFMGSGSTLAAAEALGFASIGLEINAEYFALAQRAVPLLSAIEIDDPYADHIPRAIVNKKAVTPR